jgi:hypothetical protein
LYRRDRIYGPNIASVKGKTVDRQVQADRDYEYFESNLSKHQEIFIDVFHTEKHSFLGTESRPLNLTLTSKIVSLKGGDIKDALKSHLNSLIAKGFKITELTVHPMEDSLH